MRDVPASSASGPRRFATLLLLGALVAFSPPATELARADGTADEADLHFRLGNDAYRDGDYLGALEHFLASNRLAPNRNVVFNIARAYQRLDMFPEAYRYYSEVLGAETDPDTRVSLEAAIAEIAPRVALVVVETSPSSAELFVDRVDLGSVGSAPRTIALAPGTYRVIARLPGYRDQTSEPQVIEAGQRVVVSLALERIVGVLSVTGDVGTEIRVDVEDGDATCLIPCELPLPPGPHVLHARATGHEPLTRAVAILEGETARTHVVLAAQTGSVVVRADVEDALVQIDGVWLGFTPLVVPGIAVGTRVVRVSARGYEPEETTIEVTAGGQVDLTDVRLGALREVTAASRTSERVEDAPASVSIVTADEIEAFRYPTIYEALRGQRGFALTSDSTYGNASVRGIGQPSDYNNRLLVLSDGAALNENILYQSFIGYDGRVDLGDVERIEIVRGAGSVLYGTGAVSGVVNLVPRPHDEPTSARFEVSLMDGDVGRGRGGFDVRLADDAGLRGSVSIARSAGRDVALFFDSTRDGVPDRNVAHGVDAFEAITGSVRGWVGPLIVQAFYTARGQSIPTGSFATIFDRPQNRYDDHRGLVEVRLEPRLSEQVELRTRVYANYTYFRLDYLYDAVDEATMSRFEQPYEETYHGLWVGGEARVVAQVIPQLRLSGGAEGAYHPIVTMNVRQRELDGSRNTLLDTSNPFGTVAGYVLADWVPLRELRISLGARVDGWLVPSPAESFVSVNPRLAIIARLTAVDTLKLMGGRAFRAPSTYEQYYNDGGITTLTSTCCGQALRPEALYSAELEYTHRFDDDWSVLVSGYAQYGDDFIDSLRVPAEQDPDDLRLVHYANVSADQVSAGGDVEVRRELRGGWTFSAQAGGLYAGFLDAPMAEGATSNLRVPNAPYLYGSTRAIFPILERLLRGAVRLSVEAPRRLGLTTNEETDWAVITDVVASGGIDEIGLTYAVGVYNLFDWRVALPVTPFASPTMPQRGRSFMLSLSLRI